MNLKLDRFVESYEGEEFDVTVVGGGITGAALAYEAASRGYTVALVEKKDFGGATSAATGKLIHGGLRYLKQFEIGLVREALKERRILSNIAPNLVYPYPMVLPKPGLVARLGLFVYDLLSFDSKWTWDESKQIPNHKYYKRKTLLEKNLGDFEDAAYFYDAICLSPERLTLSFLKSAAAYGAKLSNYTVVEDLLWQDQKVVGLRVRDAITSKEHQIRSKVTINASGPWTHEILSKSPKTEQPMPKKRSEGIYIITKKLTNIMTLYVGSKGHFSFAPWRGHSMIGPTEKSYFGKVEDWKLTKESISELIDYINETSHIKEKLSVDDVVFAYGGLRPLVESSDDTYSASRRSELYDHSRDGVEGLITAAGGKYTTSRHFAESILKRIQKKLHKKSTPNISAKQYLYASQIPNVEIFIQGAQKQNTDFSEKTIDYLIRHYGLHYEIILELARKNKNLAAVLNPDGEILAEVVYAIRYEMAKSLSDVFLRRTGLGTLGILSDEIMKAIIDTASTEWNWSGETKKKETETIYKTLKLPV
ncbi:glycerol-3-phosphate dehydrogenase/oxidase [Leptospira brenneri]|uniref:Glycerol-3-phosphate dehydrogenase/oxidase n=1 Tax=Leptospira brenneri TaxID=2023182 RepID=A0A2M9Y5A8_9LEPT|nr:glycerol-3-phosphate dehydrogenase/oxidase [Leptospira brenneri]PJZ46679.1 glycerol-3-phosphate dehydrogenase [Leptospira brenneri]TGK96794.1 glycerol-3-phosphate dehydrogenase/oxidase [Leptospira brenneri]